MLQGWEGGNGKMALGKQNDPGKFPHRTVFPGLQFSLAGIIGKPETFYEVPLIRFMFEILSYM